MKITFDDQTLELTPTGSGKSYRVMLGEKTVEVEIIGIGDGQLELLIDGQRITAYVSSDGAKRWVTVNGQTSVFTKSTAGSKRKSIGAVRDHASELAAPMPGCSAETWPRQSRFRGWPTPNWSATRAGSGWFSPTRPQPGSGHAGARCWPGR